jgi:poly-gamma-glutamate capsule biosynthesis protein CapA/YwtB (metallophosphatase superfamily)
VVLAALLLAAACADNSHASIAPSTTNAAVPTTTTRESARASTTTEPDVSRRVTIAFGGDVLIHDEVWKAAATPAGYDFSPMLAPIAPLLTKADLAICHLEVTLARPQDALSEYPRFRAPRSLPVDLAEAGFDGCSVASNHALDFGEQGVDSTLDAMDEAGLRHVGTARTPEEDQRPATYAAGGLQIAQLSYAFGFNGYERPAGKEWLANLIDPTRILADAHAARAGGADLVIVSLHWGNEYTHDITAAQQQVADALAADRGAIDLVVGSHAHVVQPISKVGSMWVVWGIGNFLSNNNPDCCHDEVVDGVVVSVALDADGVAGITYTPTWNERTGYRVLPIAATLAAGAVPAALAAQLRASFARTVAAIGPAVHPTDPLPPMP